MIDYRAGKEKYKPNVLGSLYVDSEKVKNGDRPIIYIGGQMEHRCHVLEQTGKTADVGHKRTRASIEYTPSILPLLELPLLIPKRWQNIESCSLKGKN